MADNETKGVKVSLYEAQILNKTSNGVKYAVAALTNQVLKDSNYYVPERSTNLKKSAIIKTDLTDGLIKWETPYARAQYYGLPNKSKEKNPNAVCKWFEVAKSKNLKLWEKIANDEFNKNFK